MWRVEVVWNYVKVDLRLKLTTLVSNPVQIYFHSQPHFSVAPTPAHVSVMRKTFSFFNRFFHFPLLRIFPLSIGFLALNLTGVLCDKRIIFLFIWNLSSFSWKLFIIEQPQNCECVDTCRIENFIPTSECHRTFFRSQWVALGVRKDVEIDQNWNEKKIRERNEGNEMKF